MLTATSLALFKESTAWNPLVARSRKMAPSTLLGGLPLLVMESVVAGRGEEQGPFVCLYFVLNPPDSPPKTEAITRSSLAALY